MGIGYKFLYTYAHGLLWREYILRPWRYHPYSSSQQVLKLHMLHTISKFERSQIIRSSMFIKHKISPQGHFIKCKARLVALYVTSVKQAIVTKSSTESELVAFSDVTSEVVCMRNFAIGQGYTQPNQPSYIKITCQPCISLTKVVHARKGADTLTSGTSGCRRKLQMAA